MIRATSIAAYEHIRDRGLLSRERFRVYAALYRQGESTSGETFDAIRREAQATGDLSQQRSPLSQSRARFTELREIGVIEEAGERECRISGRRCIVWRITDRVPAGPMVRQRGQLAEARERIRALDAKIAELAAENGRLRDEVERRKEPYQRSLFG